jgi:hypothetical protein
MHYACRRAVLRRHFVSARAEVPKRPLCNSFSSKGHGLDTVLRSLCRNEEVEQNMTRSFGSRLQKLWCKLTYSALMWPYGPHKAVRRIVTAASMAPPLELLMRELTRFTRYLAPGVLVACLVSLGSPCAAQEVDVPNGRGSGSVTAPTGWVELIAPVQQRVDLKLYGFYIGELKAPSAQVDATIRVTKFLSITPSYLYYSIPASGLNELANVSRGFTRNLEEHQFRIDGTVMFSFHKF